MRAFAQAVLLLLGIAAASGCAASGGEAGLPSSMAAAAPAPAVDRPIGPDDVLAITVLDAPELTRSVRVSGTGAVSLPLLGNMQAGGLTPHVLATQIADRLRGKYMVDPHVSVEVTSMRSNSVYVLGGVKQPGGFPLEGSGSISVLRALALGEGLTATAAKSQARIIRGTATGQRVEIPVDLGQVLAGTAADVPMQADDILFVPNSSAKSFAQSVWNAFVRVVTLRGVF